MATPRDSTEFDVAEPEPAQPRATVERGGAHPAAGWVLTAILLAIAGIIAVPNAVPLTMHRVADPSYVAWSWNGTDPLSDDETDHLYRTLVQNQPQHREPWRCTRLAESESQFFDRPGDTIICTAGDQVITTVVAIPATSRKAEDS
ncbi:hypothetical protein [Occultella gossypii]|uniref:Uncharacterized protein n=1 Tax=Occultella gossypii TaxID=2800820 RepID=A0ABS7SG56_9MICO|nr:hypothetical protein [Occultella gossypii]MBZ2198715.1 hypothetical protein [Occultella gossypii]